MGIADGKGPNNAMVALRSSSATCQARMSGFKI